MVKEFCLAWEKNKRKLEEYFRTTEQREYDSYKALVKLLFDKIRKDMMVMSYYKYEAKNVNIL